MGLEGAMTLLIVLKFGKIINLLVSGIISGRFLDAFGMDCCYDGKQNNSG
jgi:hypothetical protein